MAAPTGTPNPDILARLETFLDETPEAVETPEEARETKPPEIKVPAPTDESAQRESSEETELVATETGEEETETAEVEAESATEAEAEDEGVNTVSDLAKMFEVEESALLDHLQVQINENEAGVPLSQVIDAYRNAPEATRNLAEFQSERATFQQEAAQYRARADEHVRELAVHAQLLLDMTNEEFAEVDFKRLEAEDPTRFLILKQKQQDRGRAIQDAIVKLRGAEQQRSTEAVPGATLDRNTEIAAVHRAMPSWSDPKVATTAMEEVNDYLVNHRGFTKEDVNQLLDHRYLLTAYDAAQWRKLQNKTPGTLKTLRRLPKPKAVLRTTARGDTRADAKAKAQKNFNRLVETGDERDAAKVLEDML
jgi:hypothetical protein